MIVNALGHRGQDAPQVTLVFENTLQVALGEKRKPADVEEHDRRFHDLGGQLVRLFGLENLRHKLVGEKASQS